MIVLSHFQASCILHSKEKTGWLVVSLDLGLSSVEVILGDQVEFPNGEKLIWETVAEIAENTNNCFVVQNGEAKVIRIYSDVFARVYTLYPTVSAPTMLVSGIPMHRIKDMNPWEDTKNKIRAFGKIGGSILDTTTGLGYTAIMAAESADHVTTIELDPASQKIARQNPWSQQLFDNPKITQLISDSYDAIMEFSDETFSGIIHDPPMFSLAGELYSQEFYNHARRVLEPKGRMFHYIGNPESKSGERVTRGVVARLKKAGFSRVFPKPKAFGVLAFK